VEAPVRRRSAVRTDEPLRRARRLQGAAHRALVPKRATKSSREMPGWN
jgi:hypothetical protein